MQLQSKSSSFFAIRFGFWRRFELDTAKRQASRSRLHQSQPTLHMCETSSSTCETRPRNYSTSEGSRPANMRTHVETPLATSSTNTGRGAIQEEQWSSDVSLASEPSSFQNSHDRTKQKCNIQKVGSCHHESPTPHQHGFDRSG